MRNEISLTVEDHQEALKEVAFLLGNFASTIEELVGKATGTVGMNSGREAARKMPVEFSMLDREQALRAIEEHLVGGFEIRFKVEGEDLVEEVGRCAIRGACRTTNEQLGTTICSMFHAYLRGMLTEATELKLRAGKIEAGEESCIIREPIF